MAAQAGATLQADIDWLMNLLAVKDVRAMDKGGKDIPRDEEKVRRTYAAAGAKRSDVDDSIKILNMLAGGLGGGGTRFHPSIGKRRETSW